MAFLGGDPAPFHHPTAFEAHFHPPLQLDAVPSATNAIDIPGNHFPKNAGIAVIIPLGVRWGN